METMTRKENQAMALAQEIVEDILTAAVIAEADLHCPFGSLLRCIEKMPRNGRSSELEHIAETVSNARQALKDVCDAVKNLS